MVWSPDGNRIRFPVFDPISEAGVLWEVGRDGSGLRALSLNSKAPFALEVGCWTADGRYFIYSETSKDSSKQRGVDLALFIECDPPTITPKGSAWKERAQSLRDGFLGTTTKVKCLEEIQRPRWRKLTVQECLADVIKGRHDHESQTRAIYDRLQSWATVLFADGSLEKWL